MPHLPVGITPACMKLRPGGRAAVRTPEHMNGVPGNTPSQQARVLSSQKLLYRCTCILRAVFSAGGHISLEQPANAMSWLEPFTQDLLSEMQASLVNIPACSVGQDTLAVTPHYAHLQAAVHMRRSPINGWCSR